MESVGRSLRTIWVVAKQEFDQYTQTPLVYFISAVWLFFTGIFFTFALNGFNEGFAEPSVRDLINPLSFLLIFFAPAFTMKLVAEELRQGTHELLMTSPVREWEIITGKWLGVMMIFTLFIFVPMLTYPFILASRGNPDTTLMATNYLGFWLAGATTLAIGLLASTVTQYQAVSYLLSVTAMVFMWISGVLTQVLNNELISTVFQELSLNSHLENLVQRALIDPLDIAYFLGIVVVCIFLASQILAARRWSA